MASSPPAGRGAGLDRTGFLRRPDGVSDMGCERVEQGLRLCSQAGSVVRRAQGAEDQMRGAVAELCAQDPNSETATVCALRVAQAQQ
jgi:hypothetical protein